MLCLLAVGAGPTAAGRGYRKVTHRIGRGVYYTVIRDKRGPWRIRIVSVKLSARSTLDVALARDRLNGVRETTSSMARRHGALAAVNGDFGWDRPMHPLAVDGHLIQSFSDWGTNFAVNRQESEVYLKSPDSLRVRTQWIHPRQTVGLERVNSGAPGGSELALFSPAGSSLEKPPKRTCSARMFPLERPRVSADATATQAVHRVETVKCGSSPLSRKDGKVVAVARSGDRATWMASRRPGDQVSLDWSFGGVGVFDLIGGSQTLVKDGAIQWDHLRGDEPFFHRNPRTGVGYDAGENEVLLVTVDGRQPGYSVGMNPREFARLFKSLGAELALNLDGGGSSTTVVRGRVMNRPSDGSERPVSSALLVLPGADRGETAKNLEFVASHSLGRSPAGESPSPLMQRVARDPGSTGGLAAALLGGHKKLSGDLRRTLQEILEAGR